MFESRDPSLQPSAHYPQWLADIGGTHARFAWRVHEGATISHVQVLPCADYASLLDAARSYLNQQGLNTPPCAAFGIATPITGDAVAMTNHHWEFSVSALREALGLHRLVVLNDFTALALSLPQLPADHRRQVGAGQAIPQAAIGLIGPGTGLGVSGLLPSGHGNAWIPIAGEGGHVSLSASNALEFEVVQQLQQRYGHASAERVLCGAGLVDLYRALCEIEGSQGRLLHTAAEVLTQAHEASNAQAQQTLDMFCGFLGSVAGDLALTLGARGGVYIGGGIVPRLGERLGSSAFRSRFEAKGRYQRYLQDIPTWVIDSPVSPALLGAAQALSPIL